MEMILLIIAYVVCVVISAGFVNAEFQHEYVYDKEDAIENLREAWVIAMLASILFFIGVAIMFFLSGMGHYGWSITIKKE